MTAVGTKIRESTAPIRHGDDTNTGKLFVAGLTHKGSIAEPIPVSSMAEFTRKFGGAVGYSSLYGYLERSFAEGLGLAYVSRVVGPNPTFATRNLMDGAATPAVSLVARAKSPGDWASTLRIAVPPGDVSTDFKLQVSDTVAGILETSPSLSTQAAALEWVSYSDYITLELGPSALNPAPLAAAEFNTVVGSDDRANITDTQWLGALNRFGKSLGPGQVAFVNRTSSVGHGQLLDHAAGHNRVALLDPQDTTSKAALIAAVAAVRNHPNARHGALFGPWVKVATGIGTRTVNLPASSIVAGIIARNDAAGITPNQASGGDLGLSRTAVDVAASFPNELDRSDLNEASVNLLILKNGRVRIYGYRTLVGRVQNPYWFQFANVRLYMKIVAIVEEILEHYVLKMIDGRGVLFGQLAGEITSELLPLFEDNSLFGDSPAEAFFVDTGPTVNTVDTKRAGEIHAVVELVMSPTGETVILDIIKKQIER